MSPELDYRPSYLAAGIAALLVFVLYVLTLAPTTWMWDTSEYMAAAYTLGIPHPPGNPMFVLLGRTFSILPIAPSVAQRINLLAALSSAVSAGMWFLITERVLVSWLAQRWQRIVGGAVAALLGATAFTVWSQSVVNEKVYTVALVGVALIAWLTVRWCDDPDGPRADRVLVLIAYVLGLGYANHMAGMLAAPAVGLAVLIRRPRTVVRWRLVLACLGALLLGMTPFATQPIRAAYNPPQNTGEVTACTEGLRLDCTFSRTTLDRFLYNFNRGQYGKPPLVDRQAPFTAQVGMWWLYFKWQWLRDHPGEHRVAQHVLATVFLLLGLLGGWVHWKRDRRSFWFFGPLMFTMTLGLIFYLNFRLGWTQAMEMGVPADRATTEVRDRDYFYLWSFSAWSVWAALGLVFVWEAAAGAMARATRSTLGGGVRLRALAAPVLALALIPLVANWNAASRSGDTFTRDWAVDMLNSVEPYGILITQGDNDTFPLWYAQDVEGVRRDVIVAVTSYLGTDWFARHLQRQPIHEYDAAKGPSIYRGRAWPKPSGPPIALPRAEIDAIPDYVQLPAPQMFTKDSIIATVPAGLLTRDQILVLRFIKDSYPTRPLFFSAGRYENSLGLGDYTAIHGLTTRLLPRSADSTPGIVTGPTGWLDLERTRALFDSVYVAPRSLLAIGDWVDRPSEGIPLQYVLVAAGLAEVMAQRGDEAAARRYSDRAMELAKAARLERLFGVAEGEDRE